MGDVRYKPVGERDREFFVHVHHVSYRNTIEELFGWEEKVQDEFANAAFDKGNLYIVSFQNENVGVVGWEADGDHIWLKELFLLPAFQGQRIGSQIVQDVIARAASAAKCVRLRTLKSNRGAKRFYERHGFEVIETTGVHWLMERNCG